MDSQITNLLKVIWLESCSNWNPGFSDVEVGADDTSCTMIPPWCINNSHGPALKSVSRTSWPVTT